MKENGKYSSIIANTCSVRKVLCRMYYFTTTLSPTVGRPPSGGSWGLRTSPPGMEGWGKMLGIG
jgi:hypothetical protein